MFFRKRIDRRSGEFAASKTTNRPQRQESRLQRSRLALCSAVLDLLVGQAVHEILHLRVDQAGAAGEDVPGGGEDRVRVGADAVQVELGDARLGGDVAGLGDALEDAEATLLVARAAASLDQPGAEVELRGVEVLAGRQRQPTARLDLVARLGRRRRRHRWRHGVLGVGQPGLRRRAGNRRRALEATAARLAVDQHLREVELGEHVAGLRRRLHQRVGLLARPCRRSARRAAAAHTGTAPPERPARRPAGTISPPPPRRAARRGRATGSRRPASGPQGRHSRRAPAQDCRP